MSDNSNNSDTSDSNSDTHYIDRRKNSARVVLQYILNAMIFLGAIMLSVPLVLITGPSFESTYFPVVKDMSFDIIELTGNTMRVAVNGTKVRDCEFISVVGVSTGDNKKDEVQILFLNKPKSTTRSIGEQSFADWEISPVDLGSRVTLYTKHDCHPGWLTTTKNGEINLSTYVPGPNNDGTRIPVASVAK